MKNIRCAWHLLPPAGYLVPTGHCHSNFWCSLVQASNTPTNLSSLSSISQKQIQSRYPVAEKDAGQVPVWLCTVAPDGWLGAD